LRRKEQDKVHQIDSNGITQQEEEEEEEKIEVEE
jgi:hypothetical protein